MVDDCEGFWQSPVCGTCLVMALCKSQSIIFDSTSPNTMPHVRGQSGTCFGDWSASLLYHTAIWVYIDTYNCRPTDARGEVALSLLPILLPPPVFKRGRKVVRATVDESKKGFIDVKLVSNVPLNRNENIRLVKKRLNCSFTLLERLIPAICKDYMRGMSDTA